MPIGFNGLNILIVLIVLVSILIGILGTIFWIWMAVDCATNKRLKDNEKLLWMLLIIFTHFLGGLIYFFAGRTPRNSQLQDGNYSSMQGPYQPYQQGYQAPPPAQQERAQQHYPQEQIPYEGPQYEQTQVSYPEDPR